MHAPLVNYMEEDMYLIKDRLYVNLPNKILFDLKSMNTFQLDDITFEDIKKCYLTGEPFDSSSFNQSVKIVNTNNSTIRTIKILMSTQCNLSCKYCYAENGEYGLEPKTLNSSEGSEMIRKIKEHYPNLENITFFGGEPLLAYDAIKSICEYMDGTGIDFFLQTNGTILNQEILELIEKYRITVTVSVDGPKEVHDKYRIYKNGMPTFEHIKQNINKINRNNKYASYVQSTYTEYSRSNYTPTQIKRSIKEDFNIENISLVEVVSDDPELKIKHTETVKQEHIDVKKAFLDMSNHSYDSDSICINIISAFISDTISDYFCNAGVEQITIDTNGDIWPCQLFVNKSEYHMGNILSGCEVVKKSKKVKEELDFYSKSTLPNCINCLCRFWCGSCVGSSIITEQHLSEFIIKKSNNCDRNILITRKVLDEISVMIADGTFNDFVDIYSEKYLMESV